MRILSLPLFLAIVMALEAGPVFAQATKTPPLKSDTALIQHIKRTDHVFQAVLSGCRDERVTRGNTGRKTTFSYQAQCDIKPRPESDCRSYAVDASGTFDGPEWATVREVKLTLQCSN
jgi:hypothetical protein